MERAPESGRAALWIESGDVTDYLDASELVDDDFAAAGASNILDVDAEAIEVQDDDDDDAVSVEIDVRASEPKLPPRTFVLPPPRLPPRRPSMLSRPSLHSMPPTSFVPQPLPAPAPVPRSPMAQSVAPVAFDVAPAKKTEEREELPRVARNPFARPSAPWAVALLALGAAAGFGASLLTQPAPPSVAAAAAAPPPAVAPEAPQANVATPKVVQPRAPEPTTLRFDTPLDIRVPAAAAAPAPAEPAAPPATINKAAEATAKPTPKASPAAPKVESTPKVFEVPSRDRDREREKANEQESTFVRAPTRPALRRDLPPQAVDALVREQLSTALR